MNKKEEKEKRGIFPTFLNGKVKDILLVSVLAFVLFFTAWKIFQGEDAEESSAMQYSDLEIRVLRILEEIDGVGEASVVVCEGEDEVKSVVVVCEGANDLRVVMNIREAVATALDTQQKSVKIYLKKE